MGSKRKLAADILKVIISRHGGVTDFYDLFGGGGSISFTAIRDYRFTTHYNELSNPIFSLVKYLKENKTLEPKFYEWVTREKFFEAINNPDGGWYSGFVMSCWSFGNKQTTYLYGADIQESKRLAHEFIVNGDLSAMAAIGLDIPELLNIKGIQERRLVFCDHIKKIHAKRFDMQNVERVQNLELVEHLARLQNLQNLQNLQITNLSYEKVNILGDRPVIYCDIPYGGTATYKESEFSHDRFYEWAAQTPHPVYISEYNAPFQEVDAFRHRSSLSATNNKKKTIEKIFWNGKGTINETKLFS